MSEHTLSTETEHTGTASPQLASPVRRIVSDSVPPQSRSVPATLCTVAAEIAAGSTADSSDPSAEIVDPVVSAVTSLEGYVRIRHDLVATNRYAAETDERDAALLASDYLHAAAYAAVDDAPISDRRSIELYRILTGGSTALSRGFLEWGDTGTDADTDDDHQRSRPTAILAGVAAELGATALGATNETRSATKNYGRSLGSALAIRSSSSDPIDDVHGLTARILSGHTSSSETDGRSVHQDGIESRSSSSAIVPAPVERHLEQARETLERLEAAADVGLERSDGDETGLTAGRSPSPLDRLERATRVPFQTIEL
ncbi:polyprenyl synthetase family protein [Natronobacterium texcoconense]|uniref:Polyprenyl synthetase n=1 Tax=Natronobacterium texcoconense TaxID=1095778 RepID=A0A1H1ILW2_NATTX|nr:hypothetical protein [Natronobacterium texcoconense]SDR38654.1 hypothetical protein SAMN04489842_3612 [Natronobacterium texcoconense]